MRSLGLLIVVSLSVAACAEETVAGRSSGGGGGGSATDTGTSGNGTTDTGVQDTGTTDTGSQAQPENCIDGLDNDLDGRADCADSDCAGAGACQTGPEICGNNFDDDRNGAADCADAACRNIDPCIGESCFDGVDNNRDGFADCADALCSVLDDCVFYREFLIVVESVNYSTSNTWDLGGGAPDPFVQIYVNGVLLDDTGWYENTFSVSMNFATSVFLTPSDTVGIAAYDYDDGSPNDPAVNLINYSLSADAVEVPLLTESSLASVTWSIRYP
jgi:hypothetical protein